MYDSQMCRDLLDYGVLYLFFNHFVLYAIFQSDKWVKAMHGYLDHLDAQEKVVFEIDTGTPQQNVRLSVIWDQVQK